MTATDEPAASDSQTQRSITGLYKQFLFGLKLLLEEASSDMKSTVDDMLPTPTEHPYSGGFLRPDNSLLLITAAEPTQVVEMWVTYLPERRWILRFSDRFLKKERRRIKESRTGRDLSKVKRVLRSANGSFHLPFPGIACMAKHRFDYSREPETNDSRVCANLHIGFMSGDQSSSTVSSNLYFPHLPNTISRTKICLGKNDEIKKVPESTLANAEYLFQLYFQSEFTDTFAEDAYSKGMKKLELSDLLEWQNRPEFPADKMEARFRSAELITEIKNVLPQRNESCDDMLLTAVIRGLKSMPQQMTSYLDLSAESAKKVAGFGGDCADCLKQLKDDFGAFIGYQKSSIARWVVKKRVESELSSFSKTVAEVI